MVTRVTIPGQSEPVSDSDRAAVTLAGGQLESFVSGRRFLSLILSHSLSLNLSFFLSLSAIYAFEAAWHCHGTVWGMRPLEVEAACRGSGPRLGHPRDASLHPTDFLVFQGPRCGVVSLDWGLRRPPPGPLPARRAYGGKVRASGAGWTRRAPRFQSSPRREKRGTPGQRRSPLRPLLL